MHCYEVIPEGTVCKLYFDLEFHKPSNKGADGKSMVSSLIQVGYLSNLHWQFILQIYQINWYKWMNTDDSDVWQELIMKLST